MLLRFLVVVGLASVPLVSAAQTVPPVVPAPPVYVGLGASVLSYAPASSYSYLTHIGPLLMLGVQLTPRWALQVGTSFSKRRDAASQSVLLSAGQLLSAYSYDNRSTTFTVPLLARYTLDSPPSRFQGDVVAGVTLLHTSLHSTSRSTSAGQPPYVTDERSTFTRGNLSFGLGARYALLTRLDLTVDGLGNVTVNDTFYQFRDRLFFSLFGGVRYHFGQR